MRLSKRMTSALLAGALAVGVSGSAFAFTPSDFVDYDPDAWHGPALKWAVENDVMIGNGQNELEPDRSISRAEFVTMIDRLFQTYNPTDISMFSDVPSTSWYYDYVSMGYQMGTVNGTSYTTMSPLGTITREQAMTILARALALPDGALDDLLKFPDREVTSNWAISYLGALTSAGKVKGRADEWLHPLDDITRAEVAQLLMRCFPYIFDGHDVPSGHYEDNVLIRSNDTSVSSLVEGSTFDESLVLATGMADGIIDIKNSTINRLVCWGNHDVYIYPDVTIKEIVISRTDGPCHIHWLGDENSLPDIIFRPGSNGNSDVVDKNDKPIYYPSHHPIVYFDKQDGSAVISKRIDESGYIQPIEIPKREGYVFSGWHTEKECYKKFDFSKKPTDGMTLYAKWYTEEEYKEVEKLNALVSGATVRVGANTDILAIVGGKTLPVDLTANAANPCNVTVQLVRQDNGEVLFTKELAPGEICDRAEVLQMPEYGNYKCTYVVTGDNGSNRIEIQAMLYVSYMWAEGAAK